MFPGKCQGVSFFMIANGNRLDIPVDRTRGPEEKNPHGFTNSDWPYKCYLAMSEPIADRAVRLMKDEDLWR
jgi:hypothetical protein